MSLAFLPPYWTALMFWTQLSLGCLLVTLIQYLTGGRWGRAALPWLRAGMAAYFWLVPLFLPTLLLLPHVFPWTAGLPAEIATRGRWLNTPAFVTRSIAYLAAFGAAIGIVLRWRQPEAPPWAGPLLVGVVVVLSLAATDWMMSLDSGFASSLYPFVYAAGGFVATFSGLAWIAARTEADPKLRADFGKLLFAAILFWGYIQLSQLLIVWTGNLPHEASWYVDRTSRGWRAVTVALGLLHFAVPFGLLLSRPLKESPRRLAYVAGGIFLIHYLDIFWLTAPRPGLPLRFDPFYLLLPPLLGGLWIHAAKRHANR